MNHVITLDDGDKIVATLQQFVGQQVRYTDNWLWSFVDHLEAIQGTRYPNQYGMLLTFAQQGRMAITIRPAMGVSTAEETAASFRIAVPRDPKRGERKPGMYTLTLEGVPAQILADGMRQ